MPLLQIQDLTKKIGKKILVDHLTLEMDKGEILGLLGPNGAGKTTTIRMLVGLISKSEGQVLINGLDTSQHFEQAMAQVGVIVEQPDLYKYLSGYDNLILFSRMSKGVTRQRIDEIVQWVGLAHSIRDKVSSYSLGMRQRLGLAVALMHKPLLLLLDEPTNGLDPAGIRELREHLKLLARQQDVGIVISSHLMSEMEMMCDRVAILQKGKLVGVQRVSDMVQDEHAQVRFEVDRPDLAVQLLQSLLSGEQIDVEQEQLRVRIPKNRIPEISQKLLDAGISVYGVTTIKRTLEDKYIEITGGEPH
ncbi:putative ABC transporter ATP-binding protein YhcH [Paenibacillus albidus]|uniref:ABC transporter ATP-binding protein YhcH n=1 Tax=Paenibacillus albidus TaxID=2041023 RepID=A0A917FPB0_9BACL|nr:ABC transporter ATP-binding protein [Paenibacillus albidus]GGF93015.1 putative ABC transporter ATP-binding protein YhcH [Paenibacillus albidus]